MTTQRTINRSLIIHKDIARGTSVVQQSRGGITTQEREIELTWIFRSVDEIRALDQTLYTRVKLHTSGPLVEYLFDASSAAADDGDDVLAPVPAVSLGRWLKVNSCAPNYSTSNLTSIGHAVNISNAKQPGFMVWNVTTGKPVWAVGSAAGDVWVDATGSTAHTPS